MKKVYMLRFLFWDGTKENEVFNTKQEAQQRQCYSKSGGYKSVIKKG